ncbi:MAG: GNAT family N-acetyltransferase [Flavobacteriales bacterium]|nr:GNAT family N-acetyltransferase [Flavobacteriales bacterium]
MTSVTIIRKGEKKDIPSLLTLIQELATYEKQPDAVVVTEEILMNDGFGANKIFEFFVAELEGKVVGIALYYAKYSTWKGRCLFLEDIIVEEQYRNRGIGKKLMDEIVKTAEAQKVKRLEWQVLDWNEPSIAFYKKYKTIFDGEWINCKLEWE